MAFQLWARVIPYNRALTDETTATDIPVLVGTYESRMLAEKAAEDGTPVWMDEAKTILATANQVISYEIKEVP
jgi:hypothetical protein